MRLGPLLVLFPDLTREFIEELIDRFGICETIAVNDHGLRHAQGLSELQLLIEEDVSGIGLEKFERGERTIDIGRTDIGRRILDFL